MRQKNEIKKTQNKVNQSFQPKCSLKFTQPLNNKCTRKKDLLTKTTRLGKGFAFWLSFLRKQKITTFKDPLLSYWTMHSAPKLVWSPFYVSLFISLKRIEDFFGESYGRHEFESGWRLNISRLLIDLSKISAHFPLRRIHRIEKMFFRQPQPHKY